LVHGFQPSWLLLARLLWPYDLDHAGVSNLYASLLDGSDSHLEGYVKNIEKYIGEGNYQAQVLPQEEVDKILGR